VRRATFLLAALLIAACSNSPQIAAQPSPSFLPSPSASPLPSDSSSPSPSPVTTPIPFDLPLSTVNFSCRLSIWTPTGKVAFVSFPASTVNAETQGLRMAGSGWGLYYDRAYSRWLPVSRQAVSPDGKHYAYGMPAPNQKKVSTMHVVDVATGADHVFAAPTGAWYIAYAVLDYSSDGIYLIIDYEVSAGLALMNPQTGVIKAVADLPDIQASGGNRIFWVGTVNPADPNPLGGLGVEPNQIDRFNLGDRTRVAWFYRPSTAPRVIGFDTQGHPFVWAAHGTDGSIDADYRGELLLLTSAQSQQFIFKGSGQFFETSPVVTLSDSHGTWFGTDQGIYLYTGSVLIKVSNQPGYPGNGCF
jgi:hypothetical protein